MKLKHLALAFGLGSEKQGQKGLPSKGLNVMKPRTILAVLSLALGVVLALAACSQKAPPSTSEKPFKGVIKLDVRDSKPDWGPYIPKKAPEGAPNILFVLYDDTGLASWSPYGGRINMPTLDKLATNGLMYSQWHTAALCSPTRSTILTGRNHHLNGMAAITEGANGFPGAHGRIPDQCATVAQTWCRKLRPSVSVAVWRLSA